MAIVAPKNYGLLRICDLLRTQFEAILGLDTLGVTPSCFGPNVIVNGTFDTDLSGWSLGAQTVWEPPGCARMVSDGIVTAGVAQESLTLNTRYRWSLDVTIDSGSIKMLLGQAGFMIIFSETGHYEGEGQSSVTDAVFFVLNSGACNATVDNIVVREYL